MDHSLSPRFAACVTTGCAPALRSAPPTRLVIVVITAYALLTALGFGQYEVLAGLGSAAALGLKVASRLTTSTTAAADA